MVTQREAVDVIRDTLSGHPDLPEDMSYLIREADPDGEDAAVSVPLIEIQDVTNERDDPSNSNLVGYQTTDDGARTGQIYETKWEMRLQLDIWTAAGSDYEVDNLAKILRRILYTYDSRGAGAPFKDTEGNIVEDIYDFSMQEGERNDSLVETHSVRRWRQYARVRGAEQFIVPETEPPIAGFTESTDTQ